jgi:hypothetical protein
MDLDETSFPPVGYFFSLLCVLLELAPLTHNQYMGMIQHYFYSFPLLSLRFQMKLYPDLIERGDMTDSVIPSSFGSENLSQDMLSVILSYADIRSTRNMLFVSNLFYFETRDCLAHCYESVFGMCRVSFIEQLHPLFTQIKELDDKLTILRLLCSIHSNSIDHA